MPLLSDEFGIRGRTSSHGPGENWVLSCTVNGFPQKSKKGWVNRWRIVSDFVRKFVILSLGL